MSEYRALRASVLKLWAASSKQGLLTDPDDVTHFNEAIDQSLAESIQRYAASVKQSQNLFLAILGHDLRNPLSTTISGAQLLLIASDVGSKYKSVAQSISDSGERMSKLVNDQIDFTRSHLGGGFPISAKPANAVQICKLVIAEMKIAHPDRKIVFSATGELDGLWDASRLTQVVSNLVGNAIQYGSATDPVTVSASCDATHLAIQVHNRGPVIPKKMTARIFDPLVRLAEAESAMPKRDTSLGIGLFIAREVAIAHGGVIEVRSSSEEGTTFTIRLPRTPALRV